MFAFHCIRASSVEVPAFDFSLTATVLLQRSCSYSRDVSCSVLCVVCNRCDSGSIINWLYYFN